MTCAIACTAFTGYLPTALSPDSITASVPSITALATSDTSARVGIGIVDHRLHHLRRRDDDAIALARGGDDVLLQPGELGIADLDAEIAARHHHRVARLDDAIEIDDRFAALDLRDQLAVAALFAQQLARFVHVAAVARE